MSDCKEATPATAELIGQRELRNAAYAQLRRRVQAAGLLDKRPRYYAYKGAITIGGLALSLVLIGLLQNPWLGLANAIFGGIVFGQLGLLAHDACHNQVLPSAQGNRRLAVLLADLLFGGSSSWWTTIHNAHHANSNHGRRDPDISFAWLAFSEEQALSRPLRLRWMLARQHYLVPLLMPLFAYAEYVQSVVYLWVRRDNGVEKALFTLHWLLYPAFLLHVLGPGPGALFFLVQQAVVGTYLASVILSNHWGMPLAEQLREPDFLHQQVMTSRNIRGGALTDFWYGGLNRQIEHHLFPAMPRCNLRRAASIVRPFCREHGIPYRECGFTETWREIVGTLARAADVVRGRRSALERAA